MIDLSVIMPVYNGEAYLRQAIDSILEQTFKDFEFIIIDDASTDGTIDIIRSYTDSRIRVIRNRSQKGNYPSRNKGLELAIGKYICVMDADDIAYPQRLEIQYMYLEAHPDIWAVGTSYDFSKPGNKRNLPSSHKQLMICLLLNNIFLHSSLMIRSDILKIQGGYNEKYVYSSDYELMSRLALLGKVENLPDVLMMYRWHKSQISQSHQEEQKAYADEIRRKYQTEFIERYRDDDQQLPDEWTVGIPEIGRIIALYTYAKSTGETLYTDLADQLLDQLLENEINLILSLGKEWSLCCLRCGLIYILRNGFVEGDEDEVLSELDNMLTFSISK